MSRTGPGMTFPEEVSLRKNDQGFVLGLSGKECFRKIVLCGKEVAAEAGRERQLH